MLLSEISFQLGHIFPLSCNTACILGSVMTLFFGGAALNWAAHALAKQIPFGRSKLPGHSLSPEEEALSAVYHTEVRQRINAQPSVRFLKSCCAKSASEKSHDYLEVHTRQVQMKMWPKKQVDNHLMLTTLYGKERLTDPLLFRVRLAGPPLDIDPGFTHSNTSKSLDAIPNYTHVTFLYFGSELCGRNNEVHGGMLAAALDELLGAHVFIQFGAAFTAKLTINYRQPVVAGQVIRGRTWAISHEGRKIWLRAILESIETPEKNNLVATEKALQQPVTEETATQGQVLVEASTLFILPRDGLGKVKMALNQLVQKML